MERGITERIEQFEHKGKRFIYFDLSGLQNNVQFKEMTEGAKKIIAEYPPDGSSFSITNIEGVIYDTETKNIVSAWMEFNRPYIKQGAVIGLDGIKRIMVNSILKMSGRNNMKFFRTREEAVEWLAAL
ncbi:MAG: hypothetical protein LBQ46_02770 [Treponema sp.]|jgi:hypothetical protein|nr:hypothetical protein [Treponema sp.]